VHPSKEVLERYVDGRLDNGDARQVATHLSTCEFCRDYCDNYKLFAHALGEAETGKISSRSRDLAGRLLAKALRGREIELVRLEPDLRSETLLAADSAPTDRPALDCLATFYSETPELVLQVMHDNAAGQDYLQLTGEDPDSIAGVLVCAVELDREFLTDRTGRATVDGAPLAGVDKLSWHLKMPDVEFTLEPLTYDPDRTEYARTITLESDRDDRIEITFERKTEGKLLRVGVLSLDGRSDFGPLRVAVTLDQTGLLSPVDAHNTAVFELPDHDAEISIRLYR